jgi:hypothetical protein
MRFALTTFDNPYDPFEQFTQWFMFDEEKGYHTTAYLGRIARTSDQLSDEENNKEVERAIDEIIRYDFQNIYRKVTSKSKSQTRQCMIKRGIGGCLKNIPPPISRRSLKFPRRVFLGSLFSCSSVYKGL